MAIDSISLSQLGLSSNYFNILLLGIFWLFFFWSVLSNPLSLSTSELLSTFFPTWIHQGRSWAKGEVPKYDNYWFNTHSHPVLSTYYWPHAILATFASRFRPDRSFNLLVYSILSHYLFASIGWYFLLVGLFGPVGAIFGSLTFTYCAHSLKQQPSIVYTLSWFPWVLYGFQIKSVLFGSIAIGMMLLGGYYPLAVYLIPTAATLWFGAPALMSVAIGLLIASPQLIPFLKYLPKTIRGKVSAPSDSPTEKKFYFGLTPIVLLLLNFKLIYLILLIPVLGYLMKSSLFRVPERAFVLSVYGAIWFSLLTLENLTTQKIALLTFIQAFDLWLHNHSLLPPRPFCELWKRPSRAFNNPLTQFLDQNLGKGRVSGLPHPLFTGLINNHKTMGYCGSMQNKLMWKWRKSFRHDPFIDGVKESDLTRFGVRFAFSYKKLDWERTKIKHLYRNPNYQGC